MIEEDKIIVENEGILKNGYGIIPKLVMQDKNLSISEKGLYSYFCSFSGSGKTCYPSRDKICLDLNISNDSLGKYLNNLVNLGYLVIKQQKENGKFSNNIYTLPYKVLPLPKISVTENLDTNNNIDTNINKNNKENIKRIEDVEEIINYLNSKVGTHYRSNIDKTISTINARLKEGFTIEDFKKVIDVKCKDWLYNKDMKKYLRPETLFGNKFEGYLNQYVEVKEYRVGDMF